MLLPASLQDWLPKELKTQIDALLERARTTDAAEADEPELDIPAEICGARYA